VSNPYENPKLCALVWIAFALAIAAIVIAGLTSCSTPPSTHHYFYHYIIPLPLDPMPQEPDPWSDRANIHTRLGQPREVTLTFP
jgi:hypothetical protein